jgi:hypothetical protein
MKMYTAHTALSGEFFNVLLAGQRAPAGTYREIDSGREVIVEDGGVLPAFCDGKVAAYVRCPEKWGEINRSRQETAA